MPRRRGGEEAPLARRGVRPPGPVRYYHRGGLVGALRPDRHRAYGEIMKIQPEIHRVEIPLAELIDKAYLEDDPTEAAAYLQSLGFDVTREITWVDDVVRPVRILTQKKDD